MWNFGDGSTSTDKNPAHTYTTAGTYTVRLTATNAAGSDTMEKAGMIVVEAPTYSITMISDYAGTDWDGLSGAGPEIAKYIDTDLTNDGWQLKFMKTNSSVIKEDFGTSQSGWQGLDEATFHYHFGHGMNNIQQPWPLIPDSGIFLYHWPDQQEYLSPLDVSGKWDKNNKWVVVDACEALGDPRWGDALVTSHGILVFETEKLADPLLPKRFFQNAIGGDQTIYDSWMAATIDRYQNTGTIAIVRFDNRYQLDHDHLPGHGEVAPDEYPNNAGSVYENWVC